MSTRTTAEFQKRPTLIAGRARLWQPDRRSLPEQEMDSPQPALDQRLDYNDGRFVKGHDFSQVAVSASARQAADACPIKSTPTRCPFGGACHTCPPRVQAKLAINKPGDEYEQEADRVAEAVMRMPDQPRLQAPPIETKCVSSPLRQVSPRKESELDLRQELQSASSQTTKANSLQSVPAIVHEVLRSPGQPMDRATRDFMQPRFGHDFSQVRIHADARAAESARAVRALAYTLGDHVVFGAGQYQTDTWAGRSLLAHELVHTIQQIQQGGRDAFLARQCDPAWAGLPWEDRVNNASGMANGPAKYQCMADMIDEALYPNITVHQSTNTAASVNAAIIAGSYVELGTLSDEHVNFDYNLTAKTHNPSQYGQTNFRQPTPNQIDLYMVLGPGALNSIGPQYTRLTFDHEAAHASDFMIQFATGTPHAATAGEELAIYAEKFGHYFLDLWRIDNTACSWSLADEFRPLFTNYSAATAAERDAGFESLQMFYEVRVQRIPCNVMKFKIWLQSMMNLRPANDPLVRRLNGLPGLGLVKGTDPSTHLDCNLRCS